uniref:Putative secreted protein n=1 Tax=Anopheles triannulatus TaxID=58253 RepID=A0A2M4B7Y2_9DIPT
MLIIMCPFGLRASSSAFFVVVGNRCAPATRGETDSPLGRIPFAIEALLLHERLWPDVRSIAFGLGFW